MHHKRLVMMVLSMVCSCASATESEAAGSDPTQIEAYEESKLVIASAALDNGPPWFGGKVQVEISARAALHAWTFDLSRAASVTFSTLGTATGPDVNTVLYLYRWGTRGWGTYLARNDDHGGMVFSSLSRTLQPGRYRVVIKGRTRQAVGPLALQAECAGDGCPAPEPTSDCVFGRIVTDLPVQLRVSNILTVTAADQLPDALARQQLVGAAAHVPGPSIASVSQLLARVDGGLVRWMRIWDDAGARQFTAYEFRIAGSSYGAIYDLRSGELVARVNDARLLECRVPAGRCLLGGTYQELLQNPSFETLSSSPLDLAAARLLSESEQVQLLEAVRVAYSDAEDIAAAFESVDGGTVNRLVLDDIAGGRQLAAYEYGAGDNSYGGVFVDTDLAPVARIEDGALSACRLFE